MDSHPWPALGYEDHEWASTNPLDLGSRASRDRLARPYRAAVPPFIADAVPTVPAEVAAIAEEASAEIARFDNSLGGEVAPFASILLRSESASSSQIENLTSGAKAIALAELGSTDNKNATAVVGNVRAMTAAVELADRLDEKAILEMRSPLMSRYDRQAGQWREQQVWIGGNRFSPHDADFVPPHHGRVPALMQDLLQFAQRTDLPLLAQTAVAHAQFETIHPFTDGNGRTGRALIHALLRGHRLTVNVTVPISAGLLTDTGRYFDALTAYRSGDPVPIVTTLGEASFAAIGNGRALVGDLHEIRAGWNERIRARRGAAAWRVADLLLRQPVVDAAAVASALDLASQNARRAIEPLVEAGVLEEFTGFRRNRMWQTREVLDALDAFAQRAGRRGS